MSLTHSIWVQTQENVQFSNLDDLNTALQNLPSFADYFESAGCDVFINQATTKSDWPEYDVGDVLFVNAEYGSDFPGGVAAETWGMFDELAAQVVASHMTHGVLVVRVDIEGNQPEWFKMEPGKASKVEPKF
jgi:hypothetical protein